jgi:hypothetical protein
MTRHRRDIDIIAEREGNCISFRMEEKRQRVTKHKGAECLDFDKTGLYKEDDHEVAFWLVNRGGASVRFTTNLKHVMWVHKVTCEDQPCPSEPSFLPGEFFPYEVSKDQKSLRIINTNMERELVAFRLNFVPKGEKDVPVDQYIAYDPIGRNQNGGMS